MRAAFSEAVQHAASESDSPAKKRRVIGSTVVEGPRVRDADPRKLAETPSVVRDPGVARFRRSAFVALLALPVALLGAAGDADARSVPAAAKLHTAKRPARTRTALSTPMGAARPKRRHAGTPAEKLTHPAALPLSIVDVPIVCPADMVAVAGRVCVDRYEMAITDGATGNRWPPFFTPDLDRARTVARTYESLRERAPLGSFERAFEIPETPSFAIAPRAVTEKGVLPQGYLSADQAEAACAASGKRLCTEAEWVTACRGEEQRDFPYGDHYEQGACNVNRENHPSAMLHGNAARYHDDPRNNLVAVEGHPLLRESGATPRCASHWRGDAIYDMVGNLDEWVADGRGVFVGGFYSRGTRSGCASRVSAHPRAYSDYSTGGRCCKDPD